MKIIEQDEQHMVIGPAGSERFRLVFLLAFAIAVGLIPQFIMASTAARVIFGALAVLLGLLILRGPISSKIVIDKLTDSITVERGPFFLIHSRLVFLFSDMWSVVIDYEPQEGIDTSSYGWKVSLNIGVKTFKVDHTTSYRNMFKLASRISTFTGYDLMDKSAKR